MWTAQSSQWALLMQMENLRLEQQASMLREALTNTLVEMDKLQDQKMKLNEAKHRTRVKKVPSKAVVPTEPWRLNIETSLTPPSSSPILSPCSAPFTAPFRPPPGLLPPPPGRLLPEAETLETSSIDASPRSERDFEKVISIQTTSVGHRTLTTFTWRILNPSAKFRVSAGFPLVSAPLTVEGSRLGELRLLFAPGSQWLAQNSKRKQKKTTEMPNCSPFGSVQIKFSEEHSDVRFVTVHFTVGSMRLGPFKVDLTESTMFGCDLNLDWRNELVGNDSSCLLFCAEVFEE